MNILLSENKRRKSEENSLVQRESGYPAPKEVRGGFKKGFFYYYTKNFYFCQVSRQTTSSNEHIDAVAAKQLRDFGIWIGKPKQLRKNRI